LDRIEDAMTPTLVALQRFDAAHNKRGERLADVGLLLLRPPERAWCESTPKNSHVFAHTGGDDVHYCLLEVDGKVSDESPVAMVVPGSRNRPRFIVGDSIHEFLALGCTIGYFFLEQLVYDFDRTLGYLFDYEAFIRHNYLGNDPPHEDALELAAQRVLLTELSKEFSLSSWPDPRARFDVLQQKWSLQLNSFT
jgi:hypothetical protein